MRDPERGIMRNSHIKWPEDVSTSNLLVDEKVVLSHVRGTLPDPHSPGTHWINGCLVDTDDIKIESLDSKTRKLDKSFQDKRLPFSKTIL